MLDQLEIFKNEKSKHQKVKKNVKIDRNNEQAAGSGPKKFQKFFSIKKVEI